MLEFVEDGRGDGALETGEEIFELAVGHAGRCEVLDIGAGVGVGVHFGEGLEFVFFGDGDGVRHYVGANDEAVDFAEELLLGYVNGSRLGGALRSDVPRHRSWASPSSSA